MPNQRSSMPRRNPGPNRNASRIQQQTACAGRNQVTIRILGADRVRTHVFQRTLSPRGCRPLPLPHSSAPRPHDAATHALRRPPVRRR